MPVVNCHSVHWLCLPWTIAAERLSIQRLAKRDQSAAMLTQIYLCVFCILTEDLQKMAYVMHCTSSEFLNKFLKQQKQLHLLFRSTGSVFR